MTNKNKFSDADIGKLVQVQTRTNIRAKLWEKNIPGALAFDLIDDCAFVLVVEIEGTMVKVLTESAIGWTYPEWLQHMRQK